MTSRKINKPEIHRFGKTLALIILFTSIFGCSSPKYQKVKTYWPNGNLKEKGKQSQGKKMGIWEFYAETGWLQKREKWKNGQFEWGISFDERHRKTEITDKNGNVKPLKDCGCR